MNTSVKRTQRGPKGIWAVGGGKGGTGKTFVASNMGVYLAKLGQRVLLVDVDIGGANLHTCFGLDTPKGVLEDFLFGRIQDIREIIDETGIPNVGLIRSSPWEIRVTDPSVRDRRRFLRAIHGLDVDYVILDVGSGTSRLVMDFFLMASVGIFVSLPEPTSIENTYRFLRSCLYWTLLRATRNRRVKKMIESELGPSSGWGGVKPAGLLYAIQEVDQKSGKEARRKLADYSIKLVMNEVRSTEDVEVGFSIRSAVRKAFGIPIDFIGYINHDEKVIQSMRMRRPLLMAFPESTSAKCVENLTNKLLTKEQLSLDSL